MTGEITIGDVKWAGTKLNYSQLWGDVIEATTNGSEGYHWLTDDANTEFPKTLPQGDTGNKWIIYIVCRRPLATNCQLQSDGWWANHFMTYWLYHHHIWLHTILVTPPAKKSALESLSTSQIFQYSWSQNSENSCRGQKVKVIQTHMNMLQFHNEKTDWAAKSSHITTSFISWIYFNLRLIYKNAQEARKHICSNLCQAANYSKKSFLSLWKCHCTGKL